MRILVLHNTYRETGGEDVVVARECELLRANGNEVCLLAVSNASVRSTWDKVKVAVQVPYSPAAREQVAATIASFRPDVAHVHNFVPLLSPAAYDACWAASVPTVQSLHNYRLMCANGLFLRDNSVCEDCCGRLVPWPGVLYACYRGSRGASAAVATMLVIHRLRGTWADKVGVYIALTEFARAKFIQGGIPASKIVVKPNFVSPDVGPGEGSGGYALYVGRLAPEKGVTTLVQAWEGLGKAVPLRIVGEGPLAAEVAAAAARIPGVDWLGRQPPERVLRLMKDALVLVCPSVCYEAFPLVVVEAYSAGLPVIASDHGSLSSLVDHGRTGLRFRVGSPADLAACVMWLSEHAQVRNDMAQEARREFERRYTPQRNYQELMRAYAVAMGRTPGPSLEDHGKPT